MAVTELTGSRLMDALLQALPWAGERFSLYMRSPRFWLVAVTASAVAGFAGPFESALIVDTPMRLVFWATLLLPVIPFVLGVSLVLRESARKLDIAWGWAALCAGCLCIVPVVLYVWAIDGFFVPAEHELTLSDLFPRAGVTLVLVTVVANAFFPTLQPLWGMRRIQPPQGHEDFGTMFDPFPPASNQSPVHLPRHAMEASPLFERLPEELGQDIVCIRADNHHIEVTTPQGTARVLMRIGDAEADLAAFPGIRVHRSWWVNMAHVTGLDAGTGSRGSTLTLSTGTSVPVSRGQRQALIEALRATGNLPAG